MAYTVEMVQHWSLLSVGCGQATSLACLFIQQIVLEAEESKMNFKKSSEGDREHKEEDI